jgi:prepilin-type N-terminal cleavage/methylation domain-containing protein
MKIFNVSISTSSRAGTPTKSKAFSIIELMVVMSIVAIITAISISSYQTYNTKSKIGSLSSIGDHISQQSIEYFNTFGTYPTAAQLGYNTLSDGMTLASPKTLSPYLSNVYIPGSVTDGNPSSNPMGFAVLTLNGASFPNNMAIGADPGFVAYSWGQDAGKQYFVIGCETAFSIDGLLGAEGDYSYVICPNGTPYLGGSGAGGANLPQVCAGCSLSTVLADATGSIGYLGAYNPSGGSPSPSPSPPPPAPASVQPYISPPNSDFTYGCTTGTCKAMGQLFNSENTAAIVSFAEANGYWPDATQTGWISGITTVGLAALGANGRVGGGLTVNNNVLYQSIQFSGHNASVFTSWGGVGNTNINMITWFDGTAYHSACVVVDDTHQIPSNCVSSQLCSTNNCPNPAYTALITYIQQTAVPP